MAGSSYPNNYDFQQFLHQNPPPQPQQSNLFRDFVQRSDVNGGRISPHQVSSYFDKSYENRNLIDQHPPYIPPGLALGQGPSDEENGFNLQWVALEKKTPPPIERLFFEKNIHLNGNNRMNDNYSCQLSDIFVSTGLGLSLENTRLSSSGDSALSGVIGDNLEHELQRQDAEIDRYIKIQGDSLKQAILGKFQENQLQTMSYLEEKAARKLREKESQIEEANKKNLHLGLRLQQLTTEANTWQQCTKHRENTINSLKQKLLQVSAQQGRDNQEGFGDSEAIEDTASYRNTKEMMACKVCRVNESCVVLLPCRHLCLCRDCESKLSMCPLCNSSKYIGIEVYMQ